MHPVTALEQGSHSCLIYETEAEQMAALVPFIQAGLERGERCIYLADDQSCDRVRQALTEGGVDVRSAEDRGALVLRLTQKAYCSQGRFDPERMLKELGQLVEEALELGFSGMRITGEMTWVLGTEAEGCPLIRYEAMINHFYPQSRALAICQYDRRRFSPEIIHAVLRSHPVAILGSQVCQNPYYEPPEAIVQGYPLADRVEWMLQQLRRTRREQEIREELYAQLAEKCRALETELERRARTETALRLAHASLTERVEERTQELERTQAQLQQAQKMDAIGRLAGGVAHDFNNILVVINGYSEFLLRHPDVPHGVHMVLKQILNAGERAAALTKQLLIFSRRNLVEPQLLDVHQVVSRLGTMLGRLVGEDIRLHIRPRATMGMVNCDPGQLEQVLLNLVVNARDAMPNGGDITIETQNVYLDAADPRPLQNALPGPYLVITISDAGTGIAPEDLPHIFEPFFTTKKASQGTGLGLAIVYGIIQQMQGSIEVESQPGLGTTVRLYLPQRELPEEPVDDAEEEPQAQIYRGRETILLVEDEADVRKLTQVMLQDSGYTVLAAENGSAALQLLSRYPHPIHLLLTDVVMPGMNGRELAERAKYLRPGLRVLFTSGYTDDVTLRHGVYHASVEFLPKPYTAASLTRQVREALDLSAQP